MIDNQKKGSTLEVIDSINNLLDELFKIIIQKYNKTIPKQMILETNDKDKKIKEFIVDDKFIDNKEKINVENYRDFMDKNYKDLINTYSSYKQVFETYKPYICEDIANGIRDENGKWNFYLSEEDIKNLNDKDINEAISKQKVENIEESEEDEI